MRLALLLSVVLIAFSSSARAEEAPGASDWRSVLEHVLPDKSETAWRDVGWSPTLWDAVIRAHAEKKPILLWAMNGHALACT